MRLLEHPPEKTRAWVWDGVLLYAARSLDTAAHAHFPATLLIAVERPFAVTVDGVRGYHEIAVLAPNVERQTDSEGHAIFDLLVDPDDESYRFLHPLLDGQRLVSLPPSRLAGVRGRLGDVFRGQLGGCADARRLVGDVLATLCPAPEPVLPWDPRIIEATRMLRDKGADRAPRIAGIAAHVGLSASRFSHLFRTQMGLPLRQYRLWLRIRHAMRLWAQGRSLSEVAVGAGFYDQAHFTRTLRRMTDYTPSMLSDPGSVERCDCSTSA